MTSQAVEEKKAAAERAGKVHVGDATVLVITVNKDGKPINTIGFNDLGNAARYAKTAVGGGVVYAAAICPIMAVVKPAVSVTVDIAEENARIFFPDVAEDPLALNVAISARCVAIQDA